MNLEQKYYESDLFWSSGMLEDPLNKQRILRTIEVIPKDAESILDVGCGNGVFTNILPKLTKLKVTGTDRSETALKYVETAKFKSDITELSKTRKDTYDVVTCLEVLEHIPSNTYSQALKELTLASRKYIIISVPFNEKLKKNVTHCPACQSKFNTNLHFRSYSIEDMINLFDDEFKLIYNENLVIQRLGFLFVMITRIKRALRFKRRFNSPICVVCGYENIDPNQTVVNSSSQISSKKSFKLQIINLIDKFLPKVRIPGYWIIAVYERN